MHLKLNYELQIEFKLSSFLYIFRDKIEKLVKSAKYGDIENFFDTNTYITDLKSTDKL